MSENLDTSPYNLQPFRRAVFRGLALVLPPLLTFVILLWIGNSVQTFVLNPVEWASRQTMVWYINDTLTAIPEGATPLPLPTEGEPEVEAERPPETAPTP